MANREFLEIDSATIGPEMKRKVTSADKAFDLEKILRNLVQSRKEAGIEERELGVMFQELRVVGLGATASHNETIGSVLNPFNIIKSIQKARHPPIRHIIYGFEGVVKPGEMLLVLGRPGSGCSTFLKALSNKRDEFHGVHGEVHYGALLPEEVTKHFRGDVTYFPEDDIHFPTLTVSQTIRFAARVRAPTNRLGISRMEYANLVADLLMTVFGLQHAKDTPIGDARLHGISGGEKKRLSICEALATRACLTAWDNATRGLDASTALEYVQALRTATDIGKLTSIVCLYQASELLYEQFDKVCVIYEGKMAYFGPANEARQYFIDLGYEPANRQTTADFLVAVTDPNARIPRQLPISIPRTALDFAVSFLLSNAGHHNKQEIATYREIFLGNNGKAEIYKRSAWSEHAERARQASPYILSLTMQTSAVVIRRWQILCGAKTITFCKLLVFTFQGIIIGTVYLKVSDDTVAFFSHSGVLYFALLFSSMMAMSEIPELFSQRPIVLRHERWALYHPFIEAAALILVDLPVTFISQLVFCGWIYPLVGLQKSAGQFLIFYLFLFVMDVVGKAYFRALAAACESAAAAQTLAGVSTIALALYTGYSIPLPSMTWALRWISYINPFKYAFDSLMTNEFRTINGACNNLVPQGPGYEGVSLANQVCTTVGALPGELTVQGSRFVELAFGYSYEHMWRNFGILIAFGALFLSALFFFTEINIKTTGRSAMVLYKRGTEPDEFLTAEDDVETGFMSETNTLALTLSRRNSQILINKIEIETDDVFSFSHVNYTVTTPNGQQKQLLDDICGYVAPGKLTALMGESGAGKTTLLNVLARRVDVGVVTGDLLINGQALPEDFQSQTGYCQQLDTHLPTATIREALLFSAKLRQHTSVPLAEKEEYVDNCLRMCGLWTQRNALIGSLNVEFRKRTTIGVELAAKPRILLFLDEPTSGLDSQSAWNIMVFLRNLADNGQAILCTIHQPSAELFQVFDRLLLLKKGGQTVYFGNIGYNATTLLRYFETHGSRHCGPTENPAEFMLEVIGAGSTATIEEDWHQIWQQSQENFVFQKELETIIVSGRNRPAVEIARRTEFPTSWGNQVIELIKRDAAYHYRNANYLSAKLILNVFSALFVGFSFFKKENSIQGLQNKLFSIFFSLILSIPLSNQLQIPFLATRAIYEIREQRSRMYSWTALVTAQILVEVPWNILGSTLYFLNWYWTSRFSIERTGYAYLCIGVLFPIYYTTISQAIASMAPNAEIAAMLFGLLFSFVLTFNGVMQPFRELGWWKWMYYISPYTYFFQGLSGSILGRQSVTCSVVEIVRINPPLGQSCGQYMSHYISSAGGYLNNPDALSDCEFCGIQNSDQFLAFAFNIFYDDRWRDIGAIVGFIGINIVAIYAFTYLFRIRGTARGVKAKQRSFAALSVL